MKTIKLLICLAVFVFSFSFCKGQSWLWGAEGTTSSDTYAIAADPKGNAYLAGGFKDSIFFANNHLTSVSRSFDCFLVKYDSIGNLIWTAQSNAVSPYSGAFIIYIAADGYGNTFATGWFKDTVKFGTDSLKFISSDINLYSDVFTVKYDVSGTPIWAKQANIPYSSGQGAYSHSIATDKTGNIYVTGYFGGIAIFGSDTLMTTYGNSFIVKYAPNGNILWAKQSNSLTSSNPTSSVANAIAVDKNGYIYITGTFQRNISFGSDTLSSQRLSIFLVKFDSTGNTLWAKQADAIDSYYMDSYSVAVDKANAPYITGYFQDSLIFDSDTLKGNLNGSIFLVKYDSLGNLLWAKSSTSGSGSVIGYSLSIDSLNSVYLSAREAGKIIFDTDTFNIPLSDDDGSLIMKLDTNGNIVCATNLNCGGDDNNTIAVDPSGKYVYWGGDMAESYIFGNDTLNSSSDELPFVARWQPCDKSSEGIYEIPSTKLTISLFPNPNNGIFTIQSDSYRMSVVSRHPDSYRESVEIYNVFGEKIYAETLPPQTPKGALNEINISSQPSGVYLYRVKDENGALIGSGKFVVEH